MYVLDTKEQSYSQRFKMLLKMNVRFDIEQVCN